MGWLADFWRDLNTRPSSGGRKTADAPPLRRSGGVPQSAGKHAAKPNPRDRFKNLPDSYQPRGVRQTAMADRPGTSRTGRTYPATATRRAAPGRIERDNQGNLRENRARAQLAARQPVMGQPRYHPASPLLGRQSTYDPYGRTKGTARRVPAPLGASNARGVFGASTSLPVAGGKGPKRKRKRKVSKGLFPRYGS